MFPPPICSPPACTQIIETSRYTITKDKDGDNAVDNKGKPYRERDGHAGHYVLTASTELKAPEAYRKDQNGTFRQISDTEIKTSDYIIAELSIKGNASPGIYVNPNMVCLVGQGDAITGQETDPNTAFGNANYQLPAGAQPLAAAPAPAPAPAMAGQAALLPQAAPVAAPVAQPLPNVALPATGIVPGATTYPTSPAPAAAPMPGQLVYAAPAQAQPAPAAAPMPGQTAAPQPAHDFVNNAVNRAV